MTLMQEVQNLRDEARRSRQKNASKTRAWESQKEKSERLEKEPSQSNNFYERIVEDIVFSYTRLTQNLAL